jgi:hypothetical protein
LQVRQSACLNQQPGITKVSLQLFTVSMGG